MSSTTAPTAGGVKWMIQLPKDSRIVIHKSTQSTTTKG